MKRYGRVRAAQVLLVLLPLACGSARPYAEASPPEYYNPRTVQYKDEVFDPLIRSVQCFKTGFELAAPLIELGTDASVELRFDDLRTTTLDLSYTIEHCNADWTPSDLAKGQYLEGAFMDMMPAPRMSFKTLQPFFHYSVQVPNAMMRPTRSGNYILKVFHSGDEAEVLLTRRFLVVEKVVAIDARVMASRDVQVRDMAQQVDLTVRTNDLTVIDPFGDIKVAVLQNLNWNDVRTGLAPRFIRNDELIYDHPSQASFMGGNEFRNFELKDLRFPSLRVAAIRTGPELMEAVLADDPARHIRVYLEQPDINGRFLLRNDDVDGDPTGADYVNVVFSLPMEAPLEGGDVYVVGGFCDFECRKAYRMQYVPERKRYMLVAPLKQGFYDYLFAWLPHGAQLPDLTRLEGSHFETENDYLVLVYLRDHQQRCDRLVGARFVNSRRG